MKKYLGVKLIEADKQLKNNKEGYRVLYPNGYESWSPKETFEKAYIKVGDSNTIEECNVNKFIKFYDVSQWGDKTTVVHAVLVNGFIITESSSCVDVANFNMNIGESICKEKIKNRLWEMLGFMLQTGVKGIK